jgi:hypothetical protein
MINYVGCGVSFDAIYRRSSPRQNPKVIRIDIPPQKPWWRKEFLLKLCVLCAFAVNHFFAPWSADL